MALDPNTIALAVNSLVSANLASANVTVNEITLSPERAPQVNVLMPGFALKDERVGAARTEKTYSVPVDCYHWGDDGRQALQNLGALVNSVSAIFQNISNRTLSGAAGVEISRLVGGDAIETPGSAMGVYVGYRLTVEVDTLETN